METIIQEMTGRATVVPRFTSKDLSALGSQLSTQYQTAKPFPHIVFDNFLPKESLEPVLREYPQANDINWHRFNTALEKKLAANDSELIPPVTRNLLQELNSPPFLKFLENLTGITGLIPDPYLIGGGLHQILPGGYLKVHADFNFHPELRLDRRLNLLIYLNQDWDESYGGHLELWERDMSACAKRILPVFNRCVIFSTTSDSYHGHPEPLTCPPDRSRRSLALYYYTNGRPEEEKREGHLTIFKVRPGEKLKLTYADMIRKCAPPILLDGIRKLRGR